MFVLAISPGAGAGPSLWERVLAAGPDGFMVREPGLPAAELLRLCRWVRARAPAVELWVNGRLDVALAAGCGLHAPEAYPEVPPGLLPLSRPVHAEAQLHARAQASQVLLSPVFEVPGKGPAWGPAKLHGILDALPGGACRTLALGGITPDNVAELRHPRLDGVAVIRSLWAAPDPAEALARLRAGWV